MAGRFTLPRQSVFDDLGAPEAGALLYFYVTGTTTPLDTFSDDALTIANENPVTADAAGRFGDIFLQDQDYKVILKTSAGVTKWTAEQVRAAQPIPTSVIPVTTTYTVAASDNGRLIEADATSGAFTITLPAAATAGNGFEISIKKVDSSSNAVTVDADGSETIDGNTSTSLPNQFDVVSIRSNGTSWSEIVQPLSFENIALPQNYVTGLAMTVNSTDSDHDIDTAPGQARDDANTGNLTLASTIVKRLDSAWAVGSGNGGLDTGSIAADSVYFQWLIRRSDTGVVDMLFSLSGTAPTMPGSYDQKRLLGQVSTDSSANVAQVWQREGVAGNVASIATTSGTEHVFLGVPSWVTEIVLVGDDVSLSGTDALLVQVGDSGGLETTGYAGGVSQENGAATDTFSTGFQLTRADGAATTHDFTSKFWRVDDTNNTWAHEGFCLNSTPRMHNSVGTKSLSAALDRIALLNTGSDTFDAGTLYLQYR